MTRGVISTSSGGSLADADFHGESYDESTLAPAFLPPRLPPKGTQGLEFAYDPGTLPSQQPQMVPPFVWPDGTTSPTVAGGSVARFTTSVALNWVLQRLQPCEDVAPPPTRSMMDRPIPMLQRPQPIFPGTATSWPRAAQRFATFGGGES